MPAALSSANLPGLTGGSIRRMLSKPLSRPVRYRAIPILFVDLCEQARCVERRLCGRSDTGAIGSAPGGGVGQPTISTPLMNVTAQVVNIVQGVAAGGGLVPGGGFPGSLFGGVGGTGGFGSFFGNTNPFGVRELQRLAALADLQRLPVQRWETFWENLVRLLRAVRCLVSAQEMNPRWPWALRSLAGKAATALSGISGIPSGLGSALGSFGKAAPGLGLAASGIITAGQSYVHWRKDWRSS
jgi:hypothetical protein